MASVFCEELAGVGARLMKDDFVHSGDIVIRAAKRMATMEGLLVTAASELVEAQSNNLDVDNLKFLVATGFKIVDKELLPNIGGCAIQDFGRINQFMIDAGPINKEINGE